jgi:hypothetical protein
MVVLTHLFVIHTCPESPGVYQHKMFFGTTYFVNIHGYWLPTYLTSSFLEPNSFVAAWKAQTVTVVHGRSVGAHVYSIRLLK